VCVGCLERAKMVRRMVPHWVLMWVVAEGPVPGTADYEGLVEEGRAKEPESADDVDETARCSLFYTTGPTVLPKGLLYRHRDILWASLQMAHHLALHRTGASVRSDDVFMPLIPFFHIHGWGTTMFVPYLGAKLVLPGRSGPREQLELIRREGV